MKQKRAKARFKHNLIDLPVSTARELSSTSEMNNASNTAFKVSREIVGVVSNKPKSRECTGAFVTLVLD